MKRLFLIPMALLALAPAAGAHPRHAHVSLARATRLDRRFESHYFGQSVYVYCTLGPRGNAGCDYLVYFKASGSGSAQNVSATLTLTGWWRGHDAVVRRHGRLVVLCGQWLRPRDAR